MSTDNNDNNRNDAVKAGGIGLIIITIVFFGLLFMPAPTPTPGQATPTTVTDTGWHMAESIDGSIYRIDQPYVSMNDAQRDDANRFGRDYPEGQ